MKPDNVILITTLLHRGCYTKYHNLRCLNSTHSLSHRSGSQRSKVKVGFVPSEGYQGKSEPDFPLASESWLGIFGVPWLVDASLVPAFIFKGCSPWDFACGQISPFLRISVMLDLRTILLHYDLIFTGYFTRTLIVVQLLSCVRLFVTLWTIAQQASLSLSISLSSPKFMSTESVMPSNHLFLCCLLLLWPSIFPRIRVFPSESALCIRWPKSWSFSFSISLSNEPFGVELPTLKYSCILKCWGLGPQYMNLGNTQFNPKQYPIYKHESWDSQYMTYVRHTKWVLAVYRALFWSMRQPTYEVITFSNTLIEPAIPIS